MLAIAGWLMTSPGCDPAHEADGSESVPGSPPPSPPRSGEKRNAETRHVDIPLGELKGGTLPGRFERDPALAPGPFSIKLGEFSIDRYLYPNQPNKAPLLGRPREEASRLCGEAGARLCTELEWERACRGPLQQVFAGGDQFNEACGADCESGFGVLGLGAHPEWTSSIFGPESVAAGTPVLRGPEKEPSDAAMHRCAHRSKAPEEPPPNVGFRCCRGAPNGARVPEPVDGPIFRKRPFEPKALVELLESHPKTADLAEKLSFFGEPESINTVIGRGPGDKMGFDFTTSPLLWRPTLGAEFLVLAAKSGKSESFVLVYDVVGKDEFELASSFLMHGEAGPVILAYSDSIRPRLHFSSCWGCPGETGKVLFRPPDRAVVLQP